MNTNYYNLSDLNRGAQGLKRYNHFTRFFHKTVTFKVVDDTIRVKNRFSFLVNILRKLFIKDNYKTIYFDRKRAIVWLKDHGKTIDLNAKPSEIALAISKTIKKELKHPIPILKTGGFTNKGNTCFIAATLQHLKFMPSFMQKLKEKHNSLKRMENESLEKYELRKKIAHELYRLLKASLSGRTITGQEMNGFHLLLSQYEPLSYKMGKGGTPDDVYTTLCFSLFGNDKTYHKGLRERYIVGFKDNDFNQDIVKWQKNISEEPLKRFKTIPSSIAILLFRSGKTINFPMEVEARFENESAIQKFRLVGVVENTGRIDPQGGFRGDGHSIAYIRDQNGWIKFDDGQTPQSFSQLSESMNKNLSNLFYERI